MGKKKKEEKFIARNAMKSIVYIDIIAVLRDRAITAVGK